jgi:YVTN family beta-propeller protein
MPRLAKVNRIGIAFVSSALLLFPIGCKEQASPALPTARVTPTAAATDDRPRPVPLVTGKAISPKPQTSQDVGNLPMNLALTPDGRYIISSDMGFHEAVWAIRTSDGKGVSHVDYESRANPRTQRPATSPVAGEASTDDPAPSGSPKTNGLYYGLAIAKDNTVYAAQGAHDSIALLKLADDGTLSQSGAINAKPQDFPAGVALDDHGRLYVANNSAGDGNPFKLSGSVAIYDPSTKSELGRYTFSESHYGTSNFPFGITVLRDGSKAYVASERDDAVYAIDTHDPSKPALAATLNTGAHPVAVLLSHQQDRLYVANSLSDTISVVDTKQDKIVGTILLRPKVARDIPGVTPAALALSPDEKTLYAALSDMNAVAVIDPSAMELRGYIPTGWYPSAVAVSADGQRLFVANGRGSSVRNPNNRADPHDNRRKTIAITSVLEGNVISVKIPTDDQLAAATEEVLENNRLDVLEHPAPNPLADIGLAAGKIKHVIYIIKENRTYDQILGDEEKGNGDASLVLFGGKITPNQHALAERFVLLDNLYASGEVSGDGWAWSTQGMADAYVARNVPYDYSHRGRKFDYEGGNNGYPTAGVPATDEDGKPLSTNPIYKDGARRVPDVGNTGRNIWDAAKEAGISLRNYGFFLFFSDRASGTPGGPDNYPVSPGLQPPGHDLAGVTDIDYRRFDIDYADSDAPDMYFKQTGDENCLFMKSSYGKHEMPSRFSEWNREFQMMLAKDPSGGAVPALTLLRLPVDHTLAAKGGKHSPASCVADNDYALGEIVSAVSHSPIWNSTAIFVIEDDAQSGVDHVDAHRTTGYVISPWIKASSVDHRFYNTDSMLKTIELLLGLKPLSQYDAVADPILDWDTMPSNATAFEPIKPTKELISQLNPKVQDLQTRGDEPERLEMALRSEKMDFTHADAAPAAEVDEIVWKTVRGVDSPMPKPRGTIGGDRDGDDDDDK